MQVMVHAIGDAAIEQTLGAFEKVASELPHQSEGTAREFPRQNKGAASGFPLQSEGTAAFPPQSEGAASAFPLADRRFRIEHFQLLRDDFCPRAKRLGVIAAMQGAHGPNSASMALRRLGAPRAAKAYAIGTVARALGMVAGGSDAPVVEPDPLLGIHASVTRKTRALQPPGGFFPENALTREAALRSYTSWAAYALFAEQDRGTIEPGKQADLTVLDRDIMTIPADEILEARVLRTVIHGETVYK
jgi:predicted amidohydrolase YtcJ